MAQGFWGFFGDPKNYQILSMNFSTASPSNCIEQSTAPSGR
jgi:hypothetical protein